LNGIREEIKVTWWGEVEGRRITDCAPKREKLANMVFRKKEGEGLEEKV